MDNSLFHHISVRQNVGKLLAVMLSLLIMGYGLLWSYAKEQQKINGELFLQNVIIQLNHDIRSHRRVFVKHDFNLPSLIDAYQFIIFEPDGNTVTISSKQASQIFKLPTWTSDINQVKTLYSANSAEFWRPLSNGYRLYAYVEFLPARQTFYQPIYALPVIMMFIFLILYINGIHKRYHNWHQLFDYVQRFEKISENQYYALNIHHSAESEVLQLKHTINRLTFKSIQYLKQIRQLSNRQHYLIEKSPVALFLINRKGRLLYFNEKFAHIFATPFNKNAIYMLLDFVIGSDKHTQQLLTQITEHSAFLSLSVTDLQRKEFFNLHLNPFYNDLGQLQGYSGSLAVVTSYHQKLQKAWVDDKQTAEKLAGFDKVWAVLGHELRTPLSGMMGMIELLAEDKNDFNQEQQETISTIQQSSQTMLSLLNDMLDVAKMDAGKLVINYTSVNILQLLHQVAELMIGNAKRNNISLYIYANPDVPRFIQSDDGRMRQVILNLLSNAIKFTKQGYVAIFLDKVSKTHPVIAHKKADSSEIAEDWIKITIKDTGMGIAKKEQQKLFSYFNQANDSISQQFGGTGLGLAISNNFSQLLGGFINLESEVGEGSEFQVFLPLQEYSMVPVFDIDVKNIPIFLIVISPFDIVHRYYALFNFLNVHGVIFTDVNTEMVKKINQLDQSDLQPIFLIDELSYAGNQVIFDDIHHFKNTPKIIISMESERTIDSDIMVSFDDLIQKPPSVIDVFAKVLKIYEQHSRAEKQSQLSAELAFKKFLQQHDLQSMSSDKPSVDDANSKTVTKNCKVLVADDNPVNQKIAQKHLQALGYETIIANDGKEAIQKLNENRLELGLVLMDCQMPVLDGLSATRRIRSQKDSIPIVALTANDSNEDRQACQEAGMDAFLTKPISKTKLTELLARFMI